VLVTSARWVCCIFAYGLMGLNRQGSALVIPGWFTLGIPMIQRAFKQG
jgi:hypothetical protein